MHGMSYLVITFLPSCTKHIAHDAWLATTYLSNTPTSIYLMQLSIRLMEIILNRSSNRRLLWWRLPGLRSPYTKRIVHDTHFALRCPSHTSPPQCVGSSRNLWQNTCGSQVLVRRVNFQGERETTAFLIYLWPNAH